MTKCIQNEYLDRPMFLFLPLVFIQYSHKQKTSNILPGRPTYAAPHMAYCIHRHPSTAFMSLIKKI